MKKKLWIRLVGFVALVSWGWTYLMFHAAGTTTDFHLRGQISIVAFACAGLAGFITALWALFSVIDWALRRQARLQAASMAQQYGRIMPPPAPSIAPTPAPPPAVDRAGSCGACRQPGASLYCTVHRLALCSACAPTHVSAAGHPLQCLLSAMPSSEPARRPRAVMTSPLGLS